MKDKGGRTVIGNREEGSGVSLRSLLVPCPLIQSVHAMLNPKNIDYDWLLRQMSSQCCGTKKISSLKMMRREVQRGRIVQIFGQH